jgi:hypothetical protein
VYKLKLCSDLLIKLMLQKIIGLIDRYTTNQVI